ncbi:hypothetical protein FA15DRAFT_167200 [Coprinopsis marcescibilis]|uniref:Uncharacterized protein n=1 Tax=Coprinopsis marcescibilis TaxID=230819 RepID=A0A5C3KHE6_COPMA|nr:hypothetical protein FA15DRAFT_167200 [Coprinopsis marcescibilis]
MSHANHNSSSFPNPIIIAGVFIGVIAIILFTVAARRANKAARLRASVARPITVEYTLRPQALAQRRPTLDPELPELPPPAYQAHTKDKLVAHTTPALAVPNMPSHPPPQPENWRNV